MYADPATSYGDITRYFAEQGILFYGKELIRPPLLYRFPFKLGEHDTDIQHGPPHRGGGIKLFRGGNKLHIGYNSIVSSSVSF